MSSGRVVIVCPELTKQHTMSTLRARNSRRLKDDMQRPPIVSHGPPVSSNTMCLIIIVMIVIMYFKSRFKGSSEHLQMDDRGVYGGELSYKKAASTAGRVLSKYLKKYFPDD